MIEQHEGEKQCSACHECKPLSMFPSCGPGANGQPRRHSQCKACRNKGHSRYYVAKQSERAATSGYPWPKDHLAPAWRAWKHSAAPANLVARLAA